MSWRRWRDGWPTASEPGPLTVGGMAIVAVGLAVMGALRPSTAGFLLLLAVVGVGMGLFTSPNNASIMGAAPDQQAGMASGVLNMTRGMGTALGLALTGTVFVLAGGDTGGAAGAEHAFSATTYVLAAIAAAAGPGVGDAGERCAGQRDLVIGRIGRISRTSRGRLQAVSFERLRL